MPKIEFNYIRYKLPSVHVTLNHLSQKIYIETQLWLSSCGNAVSSKVTEALHWWSRRGLKTTRNIMENFETEVLVMLTLMEVDSLVCACGTLGLVVPEQKKGNISFF